MNALLLVLAVALSGVAGGFFLAGYLWYRHAVRLHAETFFPDDATGVTLMRYGGAAGFASFGGFLFVFVLSLLVSAVTATDSGPAGALTALPLEETAVGLFLLALATFCVAGTGYATDAIRTRFGGVR